LHVTVSAEGKGRRDRLAPIGMGAKRDIDQLTRQWELASAMVNRVAALEAWLEQAPLVGRTSRRRISRSMPSCQ
jgi:hypothetical protein